MNADTIREWVTRQPFEPFELHLSNGSRYEVRHPECIAIGDDRVAVYFRKPKRFVHVALSHINAIDVVEAPESKKRR